MVKWANITCLNNVIDVIVDIMYIKRCHFIGESKNIGCRIVTKKRFRLLWATSHKRDFVLYDITQCDSAPYSRFFIIMIQCIHELVLIKAKYQNGFWVFWITIEVQNWQVKIRIQTHIPNLNEVSLIKPSLHSHFFICNQ